MPCTEKSRWFSDPVHKSIHVDGASSCLIDTVPFQRLRLVNQLSLMHYVFPGAEHSRFLHSLGVYKNMKDMLVTLGPSISPEDRKTLEVAALLHDIGHYPFSHLGEMAYEITEWYRRPALTLDQPDQGGSSGLLFRYAEKRPSGVHLHEELGARIVTDRPDICNVLTRFDIDPNEVAQLITGTSPKTVNDQILHSAIDADRLDYLLRDSLASGVMYGLVDRDYLIRMLKVGFQKVKDANQGEVEVQVLGVDKDHGTHALEHFLLARYFHYSQIIFHKTVAVFEVIMRALIGQMIELGCIPKSHHEIEDRVGDDDFLLHAFHDRAMMELLRMKKNDLVADRPSVGVLIDSVLKRRRPKVMYQVAYLRRRAEPLSEEYTLLKKLVTAEQGRLVDWLGLHEDHVGYAEGVTSLERGVAGTPGSWEEGQGQRDALRLIDGNGRAAFAVESKDSLLRVLADYEYRVLRVFYVEPEDEESGVAKERVKRAKDQIARFVGIT